MEARPCLGCGATDAADFYCYNGRQFSRCKRCSLEMKRRRISAARALLPPKPSLEILFLSRVNREGPIPPHVPGLGNCWVWTGYIGAHGYGVSGKATLAHRLSWQIHTGKAAGALFVCHKCDNRACVRPDHLFLGTDADNKADMVRKGRQSRVGGPKGSRHYKSILTTELVKKARELRKSGLTWSDIGSFIGVAWPTARAAALGKNWGWLE